VKAQFVVALIPCLLTGCSAAARLYPVQGPLSLEAPPPIFAARAAVGIHSGSFSATLANGETCKGQWTRVSTNPTKAGKTPPPTAQQNLASAWDTVYGEGYYRANVLGAAIHIQGTIPCSSGTILHVEAYQVPYLATNQTAINVYGVATDNKNNVYKLAF